MTLLMIKHVPVGTKFDIRASKLNRLSRLEFP
jgi:hypothetical protein